MCNTHSRAQHQANHTDRQYCGACSLTYVFQK